MTDEPQGPAAVSPAPRRAYSVEWLLDLLVRRGVVDPVVRRDLEVQLPQQRARVARQFAGDFGGNASLAVQRYQVSPAELVASFELTHPDGAPLDEEKLAAVVAAEAGLGYHRVDPLELDMGLVTRTLSRPYAMRHVVLPLTDETDAMTVAVENPFDLELHESLRRLANKEVHRVVSSKRSIVKALTEIYGFRKSVESAAREARADAVGDFEQLVKLRTLGEIEATDQHIVNAVDFLLRYAFDQRASDIHIEPRKGDSQVRLRIDGVLHNVQTIPKRVQPAIGSRIKTLARMDIAEKRRPQDGRIKTAMAEREVELRVSTLPTAFGEKIVIRIFDPQVLLQDLPDLGFDADDLATFNRWIRAPHGMLLITGPTGSGKTTTLYTTLKTLADDTKNVTTVEDPIEMITDQFNQVSVQARIGLDFAATMRHILRQDPDIIMVGEIRDGETAQMAVQAALTGHLVLSTLHTNDSVSAVTRLLDLGVPPFLVSSTLVGIMAQRLVRRICDACRVEATLTADQMGALGLRPDQMARFRGCAAGTGCVNCRGTGYFGRTGLFEMLDIRGDFAMQIAAGAGEDVLRNMARVAGVRTLRQHALERLAEGLTTVEEVVRVTGAGVSGIAGE